MGALFRAGEIAFLTLKSLVLTKSFEMAASFWVVKNHVSPHWPRGPLVCSAKNENMIDYYLFRSVANCSIAIKRKRKKDTHHRTRNSG